MHYPPKGTKKILIHTADKSVDDLRWLMLPSCFALEKKPSENGTKACDSFAFDKCQCQNSVYQLLLIAITYSIQVLHCCVELEVFYLAVNSGQITFFCLISHIIMSDVFFGKLRPMCFMFQNESKETKTTKLAQKCKCDSRHVSGLALSIGLVRFESSLIQISLSFAL